MASSLPVVLVCITLLATGSLAGPKDIGALPAWPVIDTSSSHVATSGGYIFSVPSLSGMHVISWCQAPCKQRKWCKLSDKMKQVDADETEVWGVNEDGEVYR